MLTERSLYILQKLIYTGKVYKISAFAHHFDVSVRSIQYDLNRISDFLADYSFPALERPTGSSISYHLEASQEERLLELLRNTTYQIILSPHQRQLFLLLRLLSHDGFVTMDYLSQQLLVSRATVLTDLDKIRSLLPAFEIVLDSRTRRGIRLSAKERNLRELAISLTVPSPNDTSSEEFSYDAYWESLIQKTLFPDIDMNVIEQATILAESSLHINLKDKAFMDFRLYLALTVQRILNRHWIKLGPAEQENIIYTQEYSIACKMMNLFKSRYDFFIPQDEIAFVAMYLLGGRATDYTSSYNVGLPVVQLLALNLIQKMQTLLLNRFIYDEILLEGLINHLRPALFRIRYGLSIRNSHLDELKRSYPDIFHMTKFACTLLETYCGKAISDEEIGYIALHFAAAFERSHESLPRIFRALIVCSSGMGSSMLLASRIKNVFPMIQIIDVVAFCKLDEAISLRQPDFILSTLQLTPTPIPQVTVHVFLSQEDQMNIQQLLLDIPLSQNPTSLKQHTEDSASSFAHQTYVASPQDGLLSEFEKKQKRGFFMLKDLITKETLQLKIDASDWKDALQKSAMPLLRHGDITEEYVTAAFETSQAMGGYIVIAPMVAMPHARPESGVNRLCMSFTTLTRPVEVVSGKFVDIILLFGAIDRYSHTDILKDLMQLLIDTKAIDVIRNTNQKEVVLEIIKNIKR